jgi:hypothetical protein
VAKIVVPTPNTTITSVWGKSVADAVNEMQVQRGNLNLVFTGGVAPAFTFPAAFANIPYIVAMPVDVAAIIGLSGGGVTTTTCILKAWAAGGAVYNGNLSFLYIAAAPR